MKKKRKEFKDARREYSQREQQAKLGEGRKNNIKPQREK